MVGDAEFRNNPAKWKDVELTGRKMFNQKMGNKFLRTLILPLCMLNVLEIKGVFIILFDEVVCA